MSGTTLCPHCNTRFKIAGAQLEAHHGMVRCGSCLQAFDARPGYIPDQPHPQLELPIPDKPVEAELPAEAATEAGAAEETKAVGASEPVESTGTDEETASAGETRLAGETGLIGAMPPADEVAAQGEALEIPHGDLLDFNQPATATVEPESGTPQAVPDGHGKGAAPEDEAHLARLTHPDGTTSHSTEPASGQVAGYLTQAGAETNELPGKLHVDATAEPVAMTLAEQVVIVRDEDEGDHPPARAYRRWPWAVAALLLLLALFAQAAYFFRVELAARLPGLKPALTAYCGLLGCSVPLPQEADLMSIESSDLEADAEHENQITLNALLRNRAPYPQAFPSLELTLNDTLDKPLARRIFKPKDYLPPQESEQAGLSPHHELVVKLYLNTTDLRPTGYRLVLYYPRP